MIKKNNQWVIEPQASPGWAEITFKGISTRINLIFKRVEIYIILCIIPFFKTVEYDLKVI